MCRRVTDSPRQHVIRRYTPENISVKAVGNEFGLAKSSVLRILKQSDVHIRPQGQRLTPPIRGHDDGTIG
jgi:hypothetical protein